MIVRPEAERDIDNSYNWYEDQSSGLGAEFLRALNATLASIRRNPFAYPIVHKKVRRTLVTRFPHSFFYFADDDKIVITACVHHKRDPLIWQRRR